MNEIQIRTGSRRELIDITDRVAGPASAKEGAMLLWVPHTTAALTVNEGFDPDVALDIVDAMEELAPKRQPRRHAEGNSDAHILASLIGPELLVPCRDGLGLGRWQRIFLVELDGPRTRTVRYTFIGGGSCG